MFIYFPDFPHGLDLSLLIWSHQEEQTALWYRCSIGSRAEWMLTLEICFLKGPFCKFAFCSFASFSKDGMKHDIVLPKIIYRKKGWSARFGSTYTERRAEADISPMSSLVSIMYHFILYPLPNHCYYQCFQIWYKFSEYYFYVSNAMNKHFLGNINALFYFMYTICW